MVETKEKELQRTEWKVEGMTCSGCAKSVSKFLEKEGMQNVQVNPITGSVNFYAAGELPNQKLREGISQLGYRVAGEPGATIKAGFLSNSKQRFFFTLPFTAVLMLHMFPGSLPLHWLMNPWMQLALCLPVFITGMYFFGRSAVKSLRNGSPNMDVLVAAGALAAFVYSLAGARMNLGENYLFFETTATIITLVFLGNYLESAAVHSTQSALRKLARTQTLKANMIAFDEEHREQIFEVESKDLKSGDLILIKSGEEVPADAKILSGDCLVNEAIISGESVPLEKGKKDLLIGGSVISEGTVKAQVTSSPNNSVLSGIVRMVENAQSEKPAIQLLADKISAVFVPVVLAIAIVTFAGNFWLTPIGFGAALMRAVAVLVIACPCAMGLATPAAVAVGLGRGARNGVLFRNGGAPALLKEIKTVVFDKTGTLTTGKFKIKAHHAIADEAEFMRAAFSLEKFSDHPLAKAIVAEWKTTNPIPWKSISEQKGIGVTASDAAGVEYRAGSAKIAPGEPGNDHNIFITKNGELLGWIDLEDELRVEAVEVINTLRKNKIQTVLLSGDLKSKADNIALRLGIAEVYAEKTPAEKLEIIGLLNANNSVAMIGDGINDAPALAKAAVGISLSDASKVAMQSADVVLVNSGLKNLPFALGLAKHTDITIRQNLFWAFAYNVVAIPIAAFGFLTPQLAALAMGFSDVILAANSLRLYVKRVALSS